MPCWLNDNGDWCLIHRILMADIVIDLHIDHVDMILPFPIAQHLYLLIDPGMDELCCQLWLIQLIYRVKLLVNEIPSAMILFSKVWACMIIMFNWIEAGKNYIISKYETRSFVSSELSNLSRIWCIMGRFEFIR